MILNLQTLVSIGIVAENNVCFYGELTDYNKSQVDCWLQQNVIDKLFLHKKFEKYGIIVEPASKYGGVDHKWHVRGDSGYIAGQLSIFLKQFDSVQFWGDCLAFDWILLNNLLVNYWDGYPKLPQNVSYIPFDICTLFHIEGIDADISREFFLGESGDLSMKHTALCDAL